MMCSTCDTVEPKDAGLEAWCCWKCCFEDAFKIRITGHTRRRVVAVVAVHQLEFGEVAP